MKRATEAGLREIEEKFGPLRQEPEVACEPVSAQFVLQFVDEIRRLRGLIVDTIASYEYDANALGSEARAIREESGWRRDLKEDLRIEGRRP